MCTTVLNKYMKSLRIDVPDSSD